MVMGVVWCIVGVLVVWWMYHAFHGQHARGSFRACPETVPETFPVDEWQDRLVPWAQSEEDGLGFCVSPVNLGQYVRIIFIHHKTGHVRRVLEPRIESLTGTNTSVDEHSYLCLDPNYRVKRMRATAAVVSYRESLGRPDRVTHTLRDFEAHCVQHWLDIFDGRWPCGPDHWPRDPCEIPRAERKVWSG